MAAPTAPAVTTFGEVSTVALAAPDRLRADRFVVDTLGDLQDADAELRGCVRVVLREDQNAGRTGEALHAHRNTVLRRVARASSMLPVPLEGQALEVQLALELQRWIDV